MAGIYAKGFDENGQWEAETGNSALANQGAIVDLGQIAPWMKKQLADAVKAGRLVRYKGFWNTLDTRCGMGPLKTIWALPEIAKAAGAKVSA